MALVLGIYGAVNASIGLIDKIGNSLVDMKQRWKDAKNVRPQLDNLVMLLDQVSKVFQMIEAKLKKYTPNELEAISSGIIAVLQDKLQLNFEDATTALESLNKYEESSRIRMAASMKSITGVLSNVEACLGEAFDAASNIETHLKLEAICSPQTGEEQFVPHFDRPELPDNMVLDFSSDATQEGRLLRKLLALRQKEHVHGVSAVGCGRGTAAHGMGGVGKTTALRAVCYRGEVKEAFPDGISFLEFGQDTKDGDVNDQLERCIRNSGGMSTLVEMKKQSSLKGVVNQAASWLREKAILFVCDDLWRSPACEFGYLPLLKRLLADAPRSKLLVSTRDQRIAEEVSLDCETFDTLLSDRPSARNLLGYIAFGKERIDLLERPDIQSHIETILDVCAGLQIALCMAGRALRTEMRQVGDILKVFEMYASQVEHDQRPDEMQRSAQLYDHGLSYIVDASLIQCEQWVEKSRKKVNVQNLFRSLCVLEKQMVMPKSMLLLLWELSSRETDRVVQKFADLGLITKTMAKTTLSKRNSNEIVEEYGIRLHDLVLVLCQEMATDEQEERHGNVINALKRSKSVWIGEQVPSVAEWWCLKTNGYIYGNLSRHLVKCGQKRALANLLSDVRWTQRRVKVGGWLALEMDFELLLTGIGYADIKQIYEVLKRHWSEVSRDERFLTYYIGGRLSRSERKNSYAAFYFNSMMHHLSRPNLVPRSKFFEPLDSREMSRLVCDKRMTGIYMDFSRSTGIVVLGSGDKISLWSVCAQKELFSFRIPNLTYSSQLRCVAISATGELIVTGHEDGTFMRWDARSGESVGEQVKAHSERVICLAISKDGSTIVSGSSDQTLCLWNAKNGEPKGIPMHHNDWVNCVAICESESLIVSGSRDGTARRWNIETCATIGDIIDGTSVVVDENGKMVVSGSHDGVLIRFDTKTGKQIGELTCGHSGTVRCVGISPCGKMIVSGSLDGTIRIWDVVNGNLMCEPFRGHSGSVVFVEFSEESGEIISGSGDGTIRRWSTATNTRSSKVTQRFEGQVKKILLFNNGHKAVAGYTNGTLLQWQATNGMAIGKPMKGRLDKVVCIAMNEQSGWILAVYIDYGNGNKTEVILWDSITCEMVGEPIIINQSSRLTSAAVSSNGKRIVTGSIDGTLQRYCATTGDAEGEPMRGHTDSVTCIAFSPDDEVIVSGSDDKSIIRWVSANGQQIEKPLWHDGWIKCFSISGDGTVIVSISGRNRLFRWETISGQLVGKTVSLGFFFANIWTNYDGTKIAIWSTNRTITWCNLEPGGAISKKSILPLPNDVIMCAIDMNRGLAAVGRMNEAVAFCDIHF